MEVKAWGFLNHGLLNIWPYMSHLKAKIKRPVFQKNLTKWGQRFVLSVLAGFVHSAILLPKRQIKSLSGQCWKISTWKILKIRPPVPLFNLFKKSSMILYLFLKAKSQAKAYIIKTVVCCLRKRKDVKKTVKKKNREDFFRINLIYVLFEFQTGLT